MVYKKMSLSPGSLVYTGDYTDQVLEIDIYQYDHNGCDYQVFKADQYKTAVKLMNHASKKTWINVVGLNDIAVIEAMGDALDLDRMLLEDILHVSQRSKVETLTEHLMITVKMLMKFSEGKGKGRAKGAFNDLNPNLIREEHVSMVMKNNVLVTFQENPEDVFSGVRRRLMENNSGIRDFGIDYLAYCLLDAVVDHQLELLQDLGDLMDQCESDLLEKAEMRLETMFQIRKSLLQLKSSTFPLKDMMLTLLENDNLHFSRQTKVFLRDVDDHLKHLVEQILNYRDFVTNLYEMHGMEASNQMNRVMTTLTVFSAVFIPLNFMAGFFGMNFTHFTWLTAAYGIPIFLGTSTFIALSLLAVFKHLKWI